MSSLLPNIAANLASTLFQGNARDVVATPDVYGVSSSSVINSSVGKYNAFDGGMLNNLRGGFGGGALGALTSLAAGQFNFSNMGGNPANVALSLTGRLNSTMGQPFSSLSNPMQRSMNQGLGSLGSLLSNGTSILTGGLSNIARSTGLSSLFSTITTTIGDVTQNISTDDVTSALSAFNLVNQMTGDRNSIGYIDVGPQSMALTSLTGTLIGLGLGIAVNKLMESSSSDTVTRTALAANVMAAIQMSDLDTLQLCINKLGVGGVLSKVPNAALLLITRYRLPSNSGVGAYPAQLTKLKGIILQLDPNWDVGVRGGASLGSLAYFAAASADALTLFRTDPDYLAPSLIGKGFPSADMLTALRLQYPDMTKL